jgi:hypothetical protein
MFRAHCWYKLPPEWVVLAVGLKPLCASRTQLSHALCQAERQLAASQRLAGNLPGSATPKSVAPILRRAPRSEVSQEKGERRTGEFQRRLGPCRRSVEHPTEPQRNGAGVPSWIGGDSTMFIDHSQNRSQTKSIGETKSTCTRHAPHRPLAFAQISAKLPD